MLHCFSTHTQITWSVPKIYCPSKTVFGCLKVQKHLSWSKQERGQCSFVSIRAAVKDVQRRSRSWIQLTPFIWRQHWGIITSEIWWSEGLAAPTTSSPDVSAESFPHSARQITHAPRSPVPSKFKLQRCCRQMSSPGGWFGHNQLTPPTPPCPQTLRHIHYLYCTVAEVFKGKASWPQSDKVSSEFSLLTFWLLMSSWTSVMNSELRIFPLFHWAQN